MYFGNLYHDNSDLREYNRYRTVFNVEYDDEFVIQQFGGCLEKDYKSIKLIFENNQLKHFQIP